MCQIGGIMNIRDNSPEKQALIEKAMRFMLGRMAVGNRDGAGFALSYKDEETIYTLKTGKPGDKFAKEFTLDIERPLRHITLHTRFATQGAKNEKNAHPHMGPYGAMSHNGWCPSLFVDVLSGQHHKQASVDSHHEMMGQESLQTECDSEALALVFNPDPKSFDQMLVGDEVFALLNLSNDGKVVTLMTQQNTVHMAYSHKLGAVICATRDFVIEDTLKMLGEGWPSALVENETIYTFDGEGIEHHTYAFGTNDLQSKMVRKVKYHRGAPPFGGWGRKKFKKQQQGAASLANKYSHMQEYVGPTFMKDEDEDDLWEDLDIMGDVTEADWKEAKTYLDSEHGLVQATILNDLNHKIGK